MKRVPATGPVLAALLAVLAACSGDDPVGPPGAGDSPPAARLDIRLDDVVVEGYAYTAFACNPLETRDDATRRHRLAARWDWEDDGVWDTDFAPLDYVSGFVPSPLPQGTWSARCEVRDEAGHVVAVADTVALPDPWFTAPDLVARRATVDTLQWFSETDTVRAGQPFAIMANHLRWTERDAPGSMHIEIRVDGVLVQRSEHRLAPNLHWGSDCDAVSQYSTCIVSCAEPGVHTITVVVDADDELAETDETNNTHTRTFVVVP
ncbi:MAG: hypothetical protein IH621_08365 [Krumholzibacteria bacterium]|nr:hypothetical protein [Candidatus Krumholzibacteria bacterium]